MSRTICLAALVLVGLLVGAARPGDPVADATEPFYGRPWPAVSTPRTRVVLSSKLNENITATNVEEGQNVEKGDVVVQFDDRVITARIAVAEVAAKFDARIAAAQETLAYYEKELGRLHDEQGAAELFATPAEIALARHRKVLAESDLMELGREKELADAQLDLLIAQKEDYTVTSPIDGVVSHVWPEVGEMAQPGQPLVEVIDPNVIEVVANTLPELHYAQVARARRAVVKFATTGDREFEGIISFVSPDVEPISGTLTVKVLVEPESELVKPGMACEIRFLAGR